MLSAKGIRAGRAFKPGDSVPFDPERSRGSEVIEVDRDNIGLLKQALAKKGQVFGRGN